MIIERVEHHTVDELVTKLREVTMLTSPEVTPYRHARMELVTLQTSRITHRDNV